MQKEGIIFKASTPYSLKQNDVSEQIKRTIIDITRATIFEKNINDDLWLELILAMT